MKGLTLMLLTLLTGCAPSPFQLLPRFHFTEFTMSRQRIAPAIGAASIDAGVVRFGHAGVSRGIVKLEVQELIDADLIHNRGRPCVRLLAVVEGVHTKQCTELSLTLYGDDITMLEQAIGQLRQRKERSTFRTHEQASVSDSEQQ